MRRVISGIVVIAILAALVVVIARPFQRGPGVETATVTRGSLDATVELAGSLVARDTKALTFGTAGTVASVAVAVGDHVTAGEILASLDATVPQAQLHAAQSTLASAQARLAADTGGLTPAQLAQAKDPVTQAQQALSSATSAQTAATAQRTTAVAAAKALLGAAQARLDSDTTAGAADPILTLDRLAIQAAQANLDSVTAQADAAVAQSSSAVTSARSALTAAQHAYSVRTAAAPDALISADQAAIASAEAALASATQAVAFSTITSPIAGTVTEVGVAVGDRTGGIGVSSANLGALGGSTGGAAAGQIVVADLSSYRVSASASEIDVVSLALQQAAAITFDALPDLAIGGTICELGATGSAASGVVEYPLTVCLDHADARLRVGMSVNISIVLAHRENVLIVPTPAITLSSGQTVARILRENGIIDQVPVQVGISSGTRVEVTSGLSEGDKVVVGSAASGSGG